MALNVDQCGVQKKGKQCTGTPTFILSGILPNDEEVCVCDKCYAKFLRKKNKKFNFITRSIYEKKEGNITAGEEAQK